MKPLLPGRPPRDSSEVEIEAFDTVCTRLGGFDDRVSAEWVDGYMTALAAGPAAPALADWLPAMAGDAYDRAFADPEDRAQAERALQARMDVLLDQLDPEALADDPDALRLAPLMSAWDADARAEAVEAGALDAEGAGALVTGGDWADGFFDALEAHGAAWRAGAEADDTALLEDLLKQVDALRLPEDGDALRAHVAAVYGDEGATRERLVDEACYAVQDLRLWWVDNAPVTAPRRVEKQPGRNDPCPCGSGKKFKKCHGA